MFNINKEIKKYLVRIEFKGHTIEKQNGSGVIVKTSNKNGLYIFTAKHTFEKEKDENERGTLSEKSEIIKYTKIFTANKEELSIENIIELDNINENIDFIILKIKNNIYLEEQPTLLIYNDEFEKCTVSGFPKVNNYKELAYIPSIFIHSDKDYYFEFDPKKNMFSYDDREIDIIGGISGGGVFVKGNDGDIYLAGIETGLYGVNNLEAIYLIKIIEKINEKLGSEVPLGGFKILSGFENKPLSLEFLSDKLKNEYIKKMENEENILEALENDNNDENKKLKDKFDDTKKNIKDLSISYLYRGIRFNGYNNYKATANFKKAILLNKEEVEFYFHLAKSKRTPNKKQIDVHLDDEKKKRLIEINKLKEKIEDTDDYDTLEESYNELLYLLRKDNLQDEIVNYKKKLIDLYIENKEFNQAERELKRKNLDLSKNYITQKLTQLYLNEEYTRQLNDEEISKKLFFLLALMENESDKDKIRLKIDELNLYNQNMLVLNEKFSTMEYQIKDYQYKIETLSKMLSNDTRNKKVLDQLLQTDEKLDEVSVNLSHKIDGYSDKIDKKLDIIIGTIKKTNNKKIDNVLEKVCTSNRALINKIQTMYHQNDRVNKRAKIALKKSIDEMNEKLDTLSVSSSVSDNYSLNTQEIKNIIEKSNWNFYQGIKKLYESEQDSYNRKLLEMSIAFTKREHELHIENLENIIDEKNREVLSINLQLTKANEWIDELNKKYESQLVKSEEEELIFTLKGRNEELKKENKHELETYLQRIEEKYEELGREKKILLENNFAEILKDINCSIDTSSSEPLDNEEFEKIHLALEKLDTKLDDIEDNYELKIDNLNERFTKLISNPKNEKRLRRISMQIKGFENKLEEIKKEKKGDTPITLRLVESDLEKIESIMRERRLPIYHLYSSVKKALLDGILKIKSNIKKKRLLIYHIYGLIRGVLVGGVLLGALIILFWNEPYKTWVSEINYSKILTILKDVL